MFCDIGERIETSTLFEALGWYLDLSHCKNGRTHLHGVEHGVAAVFVHPLRAVPIQLQPRRATFADNRYG